MQFTFAVSKVCAVCAISRETCFLETLYFQAIIPSHLSFYERVRQVSSTTYVHGKANERSNRSQVARKRHINNPKEALCETDSYQ